MVCWIPDEPFKGDDTLFEPNKKISLEKEVRRIFYWFFKGLFDSYLGILEDFFIPYTIVRKLVWN
jgi:hypothetical protein